MTDYRITQSVRRTCDRNARWFDFFDEMVRDDLRRTVTGEAVGRALEVGVGTGQNLPFYDPEITAELVGIDFSQGMLARARTKPCRVPLTLLEMGAEHMTFPDGSFDTVLGTCVFCTAPDPILGLREVRRVCKPGGRIVLLEHVRLNTPLAGFLMDLIAPLVVALVGCHINRRTVDNARLAGLHIEHVEKLKGDLVYLIYARP